MTPRETSLKLKGFGEVPLQVTGVEFKKIKNYERPVSRAKIQVCEMLRKDVRDAKSLVD